MAQWDVLLHGGTVVTLDPRSAIAEAVAIRAGRIAAVGSAPLLLKDAGPATRVVDLEGRTVLPGFMDAHAHMDREGLKRRGGVPIAGLRSVGEIVDAVARAVRGARPGAWVVVMPMGDPPQDFVSRPDQLKEGRFPTRSDLDAVSPVNPVYVRSVWGWWSCPPFPSVANSLALREAGVTRDTAAPRRVEIVKDARGEPTGVFLEWNRAPLLEYTLFRKVPGFTYEDRREGVRSSVQLYSAAGTTAVYEGHGLTPDVIRAYRELHESGGLSVRVYAAVSIPSASKSDAALDELLVQWASVAGGRGVGDEYLRVGGITLDLADPDVAAVIGAGYPYEHWAGNFYQGLSDERFVRLSVRALGLGLRITTLICYDPARALRLLEAVDREVPLRDRRCVGVHLEKCTDEDLRRLKDLGIFVTMCPNMLYQHAQALGYDALGEGVISVRRALDAGIPVALSSDNVPYPMLWTVWMALTRFNRARQSGLGDSRLSREEALRLSVQTGHFLTWDEDTRGSIEAGKIADLVVLDGNPLTCEVERIPDIAVTMTLVGGRVVHEAQSAARPVPA